MKKATLIFSGLALIVASSCNRTENDNTAGKGGNAAINAIPKHHNEYKNIINGKVYIAYNVQDLPSKYDDSVACSYVGGVPTATFTGLKPGKYYLLGKGFDTSINQDVKGGTPYTISQETTLELTIPVTETH